MKDSRDFSSIGLDGLGGGRGFVGISTAKEPIKWLRHAGISQVGTIQGVLLGHDYNSSCKTVTAGGFIVSGLWLGCFANSAISKSSTAMVLLM